MSNYALLAPLDSADLLHQGLLGPGRTNGYHRLHKRRLNGVSDVEYSTIPLNIPLSSPAAEDAFAMVPAALISYETCVYVGFSEARSTELWSKWTNWPAKGPRRETDPDDGGLVFEFGDFIVGSLESLTDAADDSTQAWRACLDRWVVALELQDAIMDPHFESLRLEDSCLGWVKDTVEMRYAELKEIQRTSRRREMQLRRVATTANESRGESRDGGRQVDVHSSTGSSSSDR